MRPYFQNPPLKIYLWLQFFTLNRFKYFSKHDSIRVLDILLLYLYKNIKINVLTA
jgi:hypothetical protein